MQWIKCTKWIKSIRYPVVWHCRPKSLSSILTGRTREKELIDEDDLFMKGTAEIEYSSGENKVRMIDIFIYPEPRGKYNETYEIKPVGDWKLREVEIETILDLLDSNEEWRRLAGEQWDKALNKYGYLPFNDENKRAGVKKRPGLDDLLKEIIKLRESGEMRYGRFYDLVTGSDDNIKNWIDKGKPLGLE